MSSSGRLLISSLVFWTNMIMSLFLGKWVYSFLFALLMVTSLVFHSHPSPYTNGIDKVAILFVVCYGAYQLSLHNGTELYVMAIVLSFLSCIGLYFYGYCTQQYCYDPEFGEEYHVLLHFISSLGHHAITFL